MLLAIALAAGLTGSAEPRSYDLTGPVADGVFFSVELPEMEKDDPASGRRKLTGRVTTQLPNGSVRINRTFLLECSFAPTSMLTCDIPARIRTDASTRVEFHYSADTKKYVCAKGCGEGVPKELYEVPYMPFSPPRPSGQGR